MTLFGRMKPQDTFIANFLDPLQKLKFDEMIDGVEGNGIWYKEEIVARNAEEIKYYTSRLDKETQELYFIIAYNNGEAETYCCDKATFLNAYNQVK